MGDYTFAPYKVAISGLYKRLNFKALAPLASRPAVVDDTINFLPCYSGAEAVFVAELLNSTPARNFYKSMIFWSEKRPITVNVFKRLDLGALARALGRDGEYGAFISARPTLQSRKEVLQPSLEFAN